MRSLLIESFLKFDNPLINPRDALINIASREVLSENAPTSVGEDKETWPITVS